MAGLYVHRSNRVEALAAALAEVTRLPLRSVLQPEMIIVQSLGMRRWLSHELAQRQGIAMNVEFPFPQSLAQKIFTTAFPEQKPEAAFTREVLPWRVLGLFPKLLNKPGWEALKHYAEGELGPLHEYQLSQRIAAAFDRYLAYRPEVLLEWQSARGGDWQAQLWKALVRDEPGSHPPALLRRLASEKPPLTGLPERISLFGISSLPPFYLRLVELVAQQLDVHLFLIEPTDQYWGDIQSRREQDRMLRDTGATAEDLHIETGNPLLASFGKVGRDFTRLVQDLEPVDAPDLTEPPIRETLLTHLQADIFELVERPLGETEPLPADGSIRLHCCHGPMREVEVLHDQLLDLLQHQPGLAPRDILVTMPDVEAYAPFIEAVFGAPDDERLAIPFSIADRSARSESGLADTFLRLLDLHGSRFTAPAVLALLDDPAVRKKFELESSDLEIIRDWIARTGIRWGIDAEHRGQLDLPAVSENTWRAGLQRLLLGYALPGDERTLFAGILPTREVEGALATTLGKFAAFAETVFTLVPPLSTPRQLNEWEQTLRQLTRACFADADDFSDELRRLRDVFAQLGEIKRSAEFEELVPFEVLRAHLGTVLADSDSGFGFLAGQVTFCALKPMRAIPFKVVCLLGMNDGAFPRRDVVPAFDLVSAQNPRRGDRSQRDDDRYLFLESLLSARETLYLSYSGLSPRDNSISPPSVVVSELLDYLSENYALSEETLVTKHPLQAFGAAYFRGDDRLFTYSAENARTSQRAHQPRENARAFTAAPLPKPGPEWSTLQVSQVAEFFAHPAKFFARQRLRLNLPDEVEPLEESEPFHLAGLERYRLGADLTELVLKGGAPGNHLPVARAGGTLPFGYEGSSEFHQIGRKAATLAERIRATVTGAPLPPLTLDLTLGEFRLGGTLHGIYPQGQLRYRTGAIKPKDLLRAWVHHLALHFTADGPRQTLLFGLDEAWRFTAVSQPEVKLTELLELFAEGLCNPLPLFPVSSHEFARRKLRPTSREKADPLVEARKKWHGSSSGYGGAGEKEEPWFALCFPPEADPLDPRWQQIAEQVFAPIFAAREELP
jgi:exodeoxyribonuclease V gamma subunit